MVDTEELTEEEGKYLLSVARQTIEERLMGQEGQGQPETLQSPKFNEKRAPLLPLLRMAISGDVSATLFLRNL